jgi:hypothetical protein
MNKPDIIILQTSSVAVPYILEAFATHGIALGKEIVVLNDSSRVEALIDPSKIQLFVTGTICGDADQAAKLAFRLRAQSPQLTTASFTEEPIEGPFDRHIEKGEGPRYCAGLITAIELFRLELLEPQPVS